MMRILRINRLLLAALLAVTLLILAAIVFVPVFSTVPGSVTATEHGGTVNFSADDTTVLVDSECVQVSWNVENISTVEVDGDPMVGQGSRESCAAVARLDVTFRDGAAETYTIHKQIRFDSMAIRIALVIAVFLFGLAVVVSGAPDRFLRWIHSTRLARRLDLMLPKRSPAISDARTRNAVLFTMIAIVLVGALVRTYFLPKSLRYDESTNYINFASLPLTDVISHYDSTNNHIFHTVLVHFSTSIFGLYPWTMRLPAYFAGILIVPFTFAAGRRFYSLRVGLIAAAVASAASWMVEYSAYARGYSLITLDFLILLLLASLLAHRQTALRWTLFAVFSALGVATIPIMIFPIGIVIVWLALTYINAAPEQPFWRPLRNLFLGIVAAALLTLVLYTPALLHILEAQKLDTRFKVTEPIGWYEFIFYFRTELVIVWHNLQRDLSPWLFGLLVIGFGIGVAAHSRVSRYRVAWYSGAVLWLPVVFFIQFVATFERFWVYLYPVLLMTAIAGLIYLLDWVARRFTRPSLRVLLPLAVAIALVLAVGEMRSNSIQVASGPGSAAGTEAVFRYVQENLHDGDQIVCANYCMSMDLYGLIYHINLAHVGRKTPLPDRPFYVVMVATAKVGKLKTLWRSLSWKPEQIADVTAVYDAGDAVLYRLIPAAPAAS